MIPILLESIVRYIQNNNQNVYNISFGIGSYL